jgi:hypothetical protein
MLPLCLERPSGRKTLPFSNAMLPSANRTSPRRFADMATLGRFKFALKQSGSMAARTPKRFAPRLSSVPSG